jgi:hypothetical protein
MRRVGQDDELCHVSVEVPVQGLSLLHLRDLGSAESNIGQESDPHRGAEVHERDIAPVDGVPVPEAPVDRQAQLSNGIEVAYVPNKQAEEHRFPHTHIVGGSQNERLVEGEEEVHVGELRQRN